MIFFCCLQSLKSSKVILWFSEMWTYVVPHLLPLQSSWILLLGRHRVLCTPSKTVKFLLSVPQHPKTSLPEQLKELQEAGHELKLSLPSAFSSFSHQESASRLFFAKKLSDTALANFKTQRKSCKEAGFQPSVRRVSTAGSSSSTPKWAAGSRLVLLPPPSHPKLGQRGSGYAWAHFSEQRMWNSCCCCYSGQLKYFILGFNS